MKDLSQEDFKKYRLLLQLVGLAFFGSTAVFFATVLMTSVLGSTDAASRRTPGLLTNMLPGISVLMLGLGWSLARKARLAAELNQGSLNSYLFWAFFRLALFQFSVIPALLYSIAVNSPLAPIVVSFAAIVLMLIQWKRDQWNISSSLGGNS